MLKRTAALVLTMAFVGLAAAPEALACDRNGRGRRAAFFRPVATRYTPYAYSPYAYSGVAGTRYVAAPRYVSGPSYYAAPRYYTTNNGYYGRRYYRGWEDHSTRNLVLSTVAPAAVGAGVGAIVAGGKGAGIGALVGGGGGALVYLLNRRSRRY